MIYAVIPAYNEEKDLPKLLKDFKKYPEIAVIIVNDGSIDLTEAKIFEAAKDMKLWYIKHPYNLGLAAAIRTGLLNAARICAPDDIIVTLDADNSHNPCWIPAMAAKIRNGHDIAVASRYRKKSRIFGVSAFRQILSNTINLLLKILFPLPGLKDYTTGFKAYSAALIQQWIQSEKSIIESSGFTVMSEIAIRLSHYNPCCTEIPYDLTYNCKTGASKIRIFSTITEYITLVLCNF